MDTVMMVIPHEEQRYPTVGDWQINRERKMLVVKVSKVENWKYETLVAFHEFVEAVLCEAHGVSELEVDRFDKTFAGQGEPGDAKAAPYHKEHLFATKVEKLLAKQLGVDWNDYESCLNQLP